jgi:hypothetical protein
VEAFRNRPLDAAHYTFVWVDALVIKVREHGRTVNVHALVAVGVNADGGQEPRRAHHGWQILWLCAKAAAAQTSVAVAVPVRAHGSRRGGSRENTLTVRAAHSITCFTLREGSNRSSGPANA